MPRRFFSFISLPVLVCAAWAVAGAQQQPGPCDLSPRGDPERYADIKPTPGGKWGLAYIFDAAQIKDASVPVVVRGLLGVSSVKDQGGKIRCAELENRSAREVKSVTLRWALTTTEEKGKVLASGQLPPVEARIAPGVRLKVQLRDAQFADFLRPVAGDGVLNGQYNLIVAVARVEYADGTMEDVAGG
jgi:hypothetical protein